MKKKLILALLTVGILLSITAVSLNAGETDIPLYNDENAVVNPDYAFPQETIMTTSYMVNSFALERDYKSPSPYPSATSGYYPTRKGVVLITKDWFKGLIPTGHAAIVYSNSFVIESLKNGVVKGNNTWYSSKNTAAAGSTRGTTYSQDATAADWCSNRKGKPYNFNFFNIGTRKKFYCSQLVYATFYDNYSIDLNEVYFKVPGVGNPVHPLELLCNNKKTYITYRRNM